MEMKVIISSHLNSLDIEYDTLMEDREDTLSFLVAEADQELADPIFDRVGAIVRRERKATVTVVVRDENTYLVTLDTVRKILQEKGQAFHIIEDCTNHVTAVVEESHAIALTSLLHSAFGLDEVQTFEAAGVF